MADFVLYQLPPSPNSIRIRLALRFKGLAYESVPVGFEDRSRLVELSGQPLAPVLQHGERVIYDSYGIMRYLDANVSAGPRLFSSQREEHQAIERWELYARTQLGECMGMVVGQLFAETPDLEVLKRADALLAERCQKLEDALADGRDYLMGGETPNAADLTAAPFAYYGCLTEEDVQASPPAAFFFQHIQLPPSFVRTRAWVRRCMALDG